MTRIAILGSGRVGTALATALASAGHDVVIGSRTPEAVAAAWDGTPPALAEIADAIAGADVVINATPGETSLERLTALSAELAGTVLVDVTNAVQRGEGGAPGALVYPNGSLGEQLQLALPGTRVVKTLNTMLFMVMTAPSALGGTPTAFLSGDDDAAKGLVSELLADLGWTEAQVIDLGGIATARGPEAVILLVPDIMRARGFAPFAIGLIA